MLIIMIAEYKLKQIYKLIGIFVSEHFQNNEKASLIDKELLKYPQLLSKGRSFLLDIIDKKESPSLKYPFIAWYICSP